MTRIWYYQSVGRGHTPINPDKCYLCSGRLAGYLVGKMKGDKLIRVERKKYFPVCLKCGYLLSARGWVFERLDQVVK